MKEKKSFVLPLMFIGLFFFAIGFALGINSKLMPTLQGALDLSSTQGSMLLAVTFTPFLIFGVPATMCIRAIGYKRTMALSFLLFAMAFGLFIVATRAESFMWFLVASFVSGTANAVLQASVNPYITILGPIESAAQRISIMGICNKFAWPIPAVFIGMVTGKSADSLQVSDLELPFMIIVGVFVLLALVALAASLPEVKAAGEDEQTEGEAPVCAYAQNKVSILQFPHLLLGALALFLYVGVETISLATAQGYAQDLGLQGDWYGFIPSAGMIVGYIVGATCIPRFLSQARAMQICAVTALVGSVLVSVVPNPTLSVWCIFFMALGCSLMWPALWPLAMADLGKFTKSGSALLTMAIAGGAVMPLVRGYVQDLTDSYQLSYWVCVPCFLFILYYGFWGYKLRLRD